MRTCIAIGALAMVALTLRAVPAAEPFQATPQEGVLLLTNGQIIRGKITHAGDHYYVAFGEGEIRLRQNEVELFCNSLEEGYQRKRLAMLIADANEHLELAQWCIQHKLYGCAARELADAIAQEPKHPKIEVLERRLKIAMTEQIDKPEVAAEPKVSVSNDELERMVRGMPQGTVEAFTHTIQPLLLNNCTNAGCHNQQETSQFSLLRIQGRTAGRRMTHRNLHATIAQIDNADPEKSSLLLMAVQPHGGSRAPVFSSRDVMQYLQLRQWVHHVSRGRVPLEVQTPLATSLDKQPEPLLQSMPNQTPPGMTVATSAPLATAEPPKKAEEKKTIEYVPVDPYDPEIFNRQLGAPR